MSRSVMLLMLVVLLAAACSSAPTATPPPAGVTIIDPPSTIADFTLTNEEGESVNFSDLRGQYVLLAFGYTNCPDVCPLTLAYFRQIHDLLGEEAARVTFLFISVDGARDTPERLAEYLAIFEPSFIGMTSTDEAVLHEVIGRFGGEFLIRSAGGVRDNYPVDHTPSSFFVDSEGNWTRTYEYGTEPNIIVADIQQILAS